MNLDKIHSIVKRLDALLTEREIGLSSWWIMLGSLVGELTNEMFGGSDNGN